MIATQPQKSTYVILGTYGRAAYFGRLVNITDGRVYLADAMKLPWAFNFEPMVEMAMTGPPMQQALPWPKYQAPITVFRPEEMIECEPEAARKWANMEWPKFEHRMIAANATEPEFDQYHPSFTLGT